MADEIIPINCLNWFAFTQVSKKIIMRQEQLSFTNQETGIALQMSSEQSTALYSRATEKKGKENITNRMRSSGAVEKKN